MRGAALQCRITTEDPSNGFRPDAGQITVYRSAGGGGVRLDGGTVFVGAQVSPHFDSMLVKLTCRGRTFPMAVRRARRALAEFRIRGVSTNIPFLEAVLADPVFQRGEATTSFIDERPELLAARMGGDRGTKLLTYLADVTVNQPHGPATTYLKPAHQAARRSTATRPLPPGARDLLLRVGPAEFARQLRERTDVPVTDTTFRDAHQSLLATRMRTRDLLHVAGHVSRLTPELLSMEAWGGATYDVALRFLSEDPWERLALLREAMPNIPLQMLLRGRNTVGYTPYPTKVTDAFVHEAARTGLDIFRIFDSLNDVSQMRPAVEAVLDTGTAVAEVALCYTGNLLDPREKLYTLDYYLRLAEQIVDTGAHVLAIKDMAGLLRAPAATRLVTALRDRTSTCRCTCTPTTPPAARSARCSPPSTPASMPSTPPAPRCRARRASRACRPWSPPPTAPSAPPASTSTRCSRSSPTGRPCATLYAPFESGLRLPHRSRLLPRDPRRPAVEPAPAGDRPRPRRPVRGHRGHVRRGQPHPGQPGQGDAVVQGGRRPRPGPRRRRRRPGRLRGEPDEVRHPRLGHRLPRGRARRPARRLARAVPHQGPAGPARQAARHRAHRRAGGGARRRRRAAP